MNRPLPPGDHFPEPGADASLRPVRVWDLPTRLFHWVLAACVLGSIVTAHVGGNAMAWHFRLGYSVFTLLLFRTIWGLIGGRWSRFASFVYSPSAVLRYLKGRSRPHEFHEVGHSPLAAGSVFALLGVLVLQVGTGLFADDEIASAGPLADMVSESASQRLSAWHTQAGQWLLVGLMALHVGAVLFYLVRGRRDLVRPMLRGDKLLPADVPASTDDLRTRMLALFLLAACAAVVAWVVSLGD